MSAEETKKKDANDEAEDEAEANYDELATYKQCLKLMKEGETVARAIKRYDQKRAEVLALEAARVLLCDFGP